MNNYTITLITGKTLGLITKRNLEDAELFARHQYKRKFLSIAPDIK